MISKLHTLLLPHPLDRCDLCGKTFPRELRIAAHIERRSACTYCEKSDIPASVIAACAFGCDTLYQRDYLTLDEDGTLRAAAHSCAKTPPISDGQEPARPRKPEATARDESPGPVSVGADEPRD